LPQIKGLYGYQKAMARLCSSFVVKSADPYAIYPYNYSTQPAQLN
jgi:hypothetical protein